MIYLASPYSHLMQTVMNKRFEEVCRAAAFFMSEGFLIFSPIAHSHPIAIAGGLPRNIDYWKNYDKEMLEGCKELWILMLPGWKESKGIMLEQKIALEKNIPVAFVTDKNWEIIR